MTSLLYYSISRNLKEKDIKLIDEYVFKNRENIKNKTTKTIIVFSCAAIIFFSKSQPAEGIGFLTPSSNNVIERIQYDEDLLEERKVELCELKNINYRSFSNRKEEILMLMSLTDPSLLSNKEILKLMKALKSRGGADVYTYGGLTIFVIVIWVIYKLNSMYGVEAFVPINNKNLHFDNRPQPFQPNTFQYRHPPYYEFINPKRTCYAQQPGNSQLLMEQYSSHEELTQLSTNYIPTNTQMTGFMDGEQVNLELCLQEVYRRTESIGCDNFECSEECFDALARSENGLITKISAREAITALQGEMHHMYENCRRGNYGQTLDGTPIPGPDFIIDGLGPFKDYSHIEVKNPVGSAIKIASGQKGSVSQQGQKIGQKIMYQQNRWLNATRTEELRSLNPESSYPDSPANVLGLVDSFDVPICEKSFMHSSILKGAKNNQHIVFLNDPRNV